MKIKYQLSKSDFLEYQLYGSSKSESHNKKRRNNRILIPIILLVYGSYLSYKRGNYVGIILSVIWATLWFFLYPKYSKWRYKRHFEKHVAENYKNRIDTTVEMEFIEDTIRAKDFTSESIINGNELKELIETKNNFFIKLTTDLSLIVPKHSIENKTEFKKHLTELGAEYMDELNWRWK